MQRWALFFAIPLVLASGLDAQAPANDQRHDHFVGQPRRGAEIEDRACRLDGGADQWIASAVTRLQDGQHAAEQAQREAAAARDAHDLIGEGSALLRGASALFGIDSIDRALDMARSAVVVFQRAHSDSLLADALWSFGAIEAARDRYDLALAAYQQSLGQRHLGRSAVANDLNGIAMAYQSLGRADSALFYLDSALRTAAPTDSDLRSDVLNNKGLVHLELGSYARSAADRAEINAALEAFQSSLDTLTDGDDETRATTLVNIGVAHRRLFQLDRRRTHLEQSLAAYRKALAIETATPDIRERARTCHNIALIHGDLKDAKRSRAQLEAALRIHTATKDRYWQGMALAELAGSLRRLAPRDLRRAATLYDSAAVVFAGLAVTAGGDANRLDFDEQRMVLGVFDDWALTSLHLGAEGAREALAAAERGRAQALLLLMRDSAVTPAPTRIALPALSYLLTRDTLVVWITQSSGAVHVAAERIPMDSVSAFVGDARAAIDARSTQSGVQRRGGFGDSGPSKRPPVSIDVALRRLGKLLLPQTLRQYLPPAGEELAIIPSGTLGLVPFAALPIGRDAEPLGIRYALRYAPSFATLALADSEAAHRPDPRIAGWGHSVIVGDPLMPKAHEPDGTPLAFGPLHEARDEAQWLGDSLHVAPLLGPEATEDSVRALLPDAPLVHLATHGLAYDRDDRARASFVALASGRNTDGLLTVGELLDDKRPLHASLVVLSACETALGDLKQAEGTVGLQRAFLARRASSVLVSLWSVSDEATALLMRRFYLHWVYDAKRPSKAEALRLAERDVRDTLGSDRPELWAAFQLVGAR